jgi:hypothetical protein
MAGPYKKKFFDPSIVWQQSIPPRIKTVISGKEVALTATREPLVDQEVLPQNGFPAGQTRQLTFFTRGDGNAVQFGYFGQAFNKTRSDTTMLQGGSLGEPEVFDAYAIAVIPEFGMSFGDLLEFYRRAHIFFKFGSTQTVVDFPLRLVPSAVGLDGVSNEFGMGSAHNGWAQLSNAFPLTVKGMPRRIFSNEKPSVQIIWDINPEMSRDYLVMVAFLGVRYRP